MDPLLVTQSLLSASAVLLTGFLVALKQLTHPRAGLKRALALGLHSRFFTLLETKSQRSIDVLALKALLKHARKDQYIVITGPNGIGE